MRNIGDGPAADHGPVSASKVCHSSSLFGFTCRRIEYFCSFASYTMLPPTRSPSLLHARHGNMWVSYARSVFTFTGVLHDVPWSSLNVYIGTCWVLSM